MPEHDYTREDWLIVIIVAALCVGAVVWNLAKGA